MPASVPFRFAGACLLASTLLAALWSAPAHAEVRRCTKPDGDTVYTDHRCSDVGAIEREVDPASDSAEVGGGSIYRAGCPHTVQDLVFEMTLAFDAGDVNQLASLYHWADLSSSAASAAMQRLDDLVQQPLVAVVPVMAVPALAAPTGAFDPLDPVRSYRVSAGRRPQPVAVRVEQTTGDGAMPMQTVFDLYPYFGCLWIRN